MSGPIVRKYGFPNFEKIFGERPLQHGDEGAEAPTTAEPEKAEAKTAKSKAPKKPAAPKTKQKG